MPYSLAAIARRSSPARRRATIAIPRIIPPTSLSVPYDRLLAQVPAKWLELVRAKVLDAYDRALVVRRRTLGLGDTLTRDSPGDLGEELDAAADGVDALVLTLTPRMRNYAVGVETWHRAQWVARIRAAVGVNVGGIVGAIGAEETVEAFYQRNLGLISSISDETRRRIGNVVWSGYEQLTPRDTIAREIAEAVGMSRDRARRIAVDQTTKLSAALDQQRQREAGIEGYTWRHSKKVHPRLEHIARDGKQFRWAKPPADGPPGTLPFCGCHAEAVLDLAEDEGAADIAAA